MISKYTSKILSIFLIVFTAYNTYGQGTEILKFKRQEAVNIQSIIDRYKIVTWTVIQIQGLSRL